MHRTSKTSIFCSAPILALLVSCCCVWISAAQEQKSNIATILHNFSGYHLLDLRERDSDTRAYLQKHVTNSPSVIHADFDGDGFPDYAMLLRSDRSAAKLVVLLCDAQGQCRSVYELDITGYSDVAYLQPLPLGSLKAVGIQVVYFEKGRVVLSWDKKLKKIAEVPTGE
jgi:hypothetical protein